MGSVELGHAVTIRRRALGLSVSEAARRAGINRATWSAIEGGRVPHVHNRAAIERTLQWDPGSVDALLDGRPANGTEQKAPERRSAEPAIVDEEWLQSELDRIKHLPVSFDTKKALIRAVIDMVADAAEAAQSTQDPSKRSA